jgi:hypothetical protein
VSECAYQLPLFILPVAPSKVALIEGAHLKSFKTKTSKVFTALKILEYEEFQIAKKAKVRRNVCDAFEVVVVEGEVDYATSLEKNLTLAKEVEWARSKFDSLK